MPLLPRECNPQHVLGRVGSGREGADSVTVSKTTAKRRGLGVSFWRLFASSTGSNLSDEQLERVIDHLRRALARAEALGAAAV